MPASDLNTYLRDDGQYLFNILHQVQQDQLAFWQLTDGLGNMTQFSNSAKSNYAFVGEGSDSRAFFGNSNGANSYLALDGSHNLKIWAGGSSTEAGLWPADYANFTLGGNTGNFTTGLDLNNFTVVSGGIYRACAFVVIQNQNGGGTSAGSVHVMNATAGGGSDLYGIPPNFTAPSGSSQNTGVIIPPFFFTASSSVASIRVNVSSGTVNVLQQGTTLGTGPGPFWATQAYVERVG